MRGRWIWDRERQEMVPADEFYARKYSDVAVSDLPRPYIATDTMEPTQHPCTGEYFTSKAKFRAVTKAHGCVEVGNDPARLRPKPKPKPDRNAIRKSLKKAAEIVASRS